MRCVAGLSTTEIDAVSSKRSCSLSQTGSKTADISNKTSPVPQPLSSSWRRGCGERGVSADSLCCTELPAMASVKLVVLEEFEGTRNELLPHDDVMDGESQSRDELFTGVTAREHFLKEFDRAIIGDESLMTSPPSLLRRKRPSSQHLCFLLGSRSADSGDGGVRARRQPIGEPKGGTGGVVGLASHE